MNKKYLVMINGEELSGKYSLDEMLDVGLLDDYDENIKVRLNTSETWCVARDFPFNLYESSSKPKYRINESGELEIITNTRSNAPKTKKPKEYRIDEFGQIVRNTNPGRSSSDHTRRTGLQLSTTSLHFQGQGGTRTITVTANDSWSISVEGRAWIHLSQSGNTLTVRADQNNSSSSREDFFKLKSGRDEVRVEIYQSGNSSAPTNTTTVVSSNNDDFDGCSLVFWLIFIGALLAGIFS